MTDVATGKGQSVEPTASLEEQIMFDDDQSFNEASSEEADINTDQEPENEPKTPEGEEEQETGEDTQSLEETNDEPQGDTQEDETSNDEESEEDAEDSEESEEEPEDQPEEKKEEETKVYQIGSEQFSSIDSVVARANELMGRNANFVGENKNLKTQVETLQQQVDEAYKINKQWQEYYDENNTDVDEPPNKQPQLSPEELANLTAQKIQQQQQQERLEREKAERASVVREEHTKISHLPNFAELSIDYWRIIENEVNDPLTGQPFSSPTRVYDYLCKEKGLINHYNKPEKKEVKTPPKIDKKIVKRPTGKSSGAKKPVTKQTQLDEVDEFLNDQFPLMN